MTNPSFTGMPEKAKTRLEKGKENLQKIDGTDGEQVIRSLEEIAPDLGSYIIEFAFGDIYAREGLSLQERELITLSSLLTAGGCEAQLAVHISASLHVGIAPDKIVEAFLQCIPYTGFPKVLNAVSTAKKIFTDRGVSIPPSSSRTDNFSTDKSPCRQSSADPFLTDNPE